MAIVANLNRDDCGWLLYPMDSIASDVIVRGVSRKRVAL
jgi:hypothetical protein